MFFCNKKIYYRKANSEEYKLDIQEIYLNNIRGNVNIWNSMILTYVCLLHEVLKEKFYMGV